jgi:hypothetical protein
VADVLAEAGEVRPTRLCGVTLCAVLGVAVALLPDRAVLAPGEAELVARGCFFLWAEGEADGDWDWVTMALAVSCCVLGAGPALKPRLEADPLPGDTIRNAATMTAATVTGATPNSRAFIGLGSRGRGWRG